MVISTSFRVDRLGLDIAGATSPHLPPPPSAAGARNLCFSSCKRALLREAVRRKTRSPEVFRRSGLRGEHDVAMALHHRPPGDETVPDLRGFEARKGALEPAGPR